MAKPQPTDPVVTVTFSGPIGAGKSTLAALLLKALRQYGLQDIVEIETLYKGEKAFPHNKQLIKQIATEMDFTLLRYDLTGMKRKIRLVELVNDDKIKPPKVKRDWNWQKLFDLRKHAGKITLVVIIISMFVITYLLDVSNERVEAPRRARLAAYTKICNAQNGVSIDTPGGNKVCYSRNPMTIIGAFNYAD